MKWLISIWAIFVLVLNVVPCADAYNDCASTVPTSQSSNHSHTSNETHEHSEDHDDTCSPFCTCACCGISFTTLAFQINKINNKLDWDFFEKKFSIRNVTLPPSFFGNIWQPPKILA